jgi:hypothetical protein
LASPRHIYLGIKAGANGACEHGHYDPGSFVFDAGGVRLAIYLGPDNYALPGYWGGAITALARSETTQSSYRRMPAAIARAAIIQTSFVVDLTVAYSAAARAW